MNSHPAAGIFPLMSGSELQELCDSIRENGLRESITRLSDGRIVDGRNRHQACQLIGIEPLFETIEMDDQAVMEFVIDENLHRRHLNATQRACVGVRILKYEQELAAERKLEGQRSGGRGRKKTLGENSPQVKGKATAQAAKKVGVDEKYVREVAKIAEDAEAVASMESGEKTLQQVKREKVEQRRQEKRDADQARIDEHVEPLDNLEGVFSTVVIDLPWDYSDEGAPGDIYGRGLPTYQTLSIEQLLELTTVGEVPTPKLAADNSHLYLWVTNRSQRKGYQLLDEWGFRHVTCLTWCKPSFGMGNYFRGSTEHLLFGLRGSLPLKRKDVGTWFSAKGGEHSAKPDESYRLIESCSPGPYLEIFARRNRSGWSCLGGRRTGGDAPGVFGGGMTGRTYTDAEFEAAAVRHHTHELEALTRQDTADRADVAVLERGELTTAGDFASAIAQR